MPDDDEAVTAYNYFIFGPEDAARWIEAGNATVELSGAADEAVMRLADAVVYGRGLGTQRVAILELASEAQLRLDTWDRAMIGRAPTWRFAQVCALWKRRAARVIRMATSFEGELPPPRTSPWMATFVEVFQSYSRAGCARSKIIQDVAAELTRR